MTRGIHLKQLRQNDLTALGVEQERLPARESAEPYTGPHVGLLSETDPALSQIVGEVREGLEGTLRLLEEALSKIR